jgi:hypothetical protein
VIDAERANYPIAFMCRLLRVPRSSFYAWTNRVETPTQARRRMLAGAITAEFEDSRQTSGCRRITAALNRAGIECSVGLVADPMRELGIAAVQPRAYKRTTLPGSVTQPARDLLGLHRRRSRGSDWSTTSPTCAPVKGGCTWLPSWTCHRDGRRLADRCAHAHRTGHRRPADGD